MTTLIVFALLSAVAAGSVTALVTTWRRMNDLREETGRLRSALTRKRPAAISLQEARLSRRLESLQSEAVALTLQVAPHARLDDPADCVGFLRQVLDDQQRANVEYQSQFDRARDELLSTRRRLEEARSALSQLRIRRGASESQLSRLEEALAAVMVDRDQLRWQLQQLSAEEEPLKQAS